MINAIGNSIIKCFISLYNKYIDYNQAIFELNLAHGLRESITDLLNAKYYQKWLRNAHANKGKLTPLWKHFSSYDESPPRLILMDHKESIVHQFANVKIVIQDEQKDSENKSNQINDDDFENARIHAEFVDYLKMQTITNDQIGSDNKHELLLNAMIEWLLFRLLSEMEEVVLEVTSLISSSYLRLSFCQKLFGKDGHMLQKISHATS